MNWTHPEALYLILPLCAGWFVLALDSDRRRHRAREAFASTSMWSRIFPEESRIRFWAKLGLRQVAIVSGLVALAGPQFGMQYEQIVPRGSDLYVLIDVSRSMLADDVPPSRLGRAKADVSSLVNRLEGERIGLIAFAGQAVVKCPLTVDYDSFRRALDELDPDSAPRGGTAIGDAIRKALEVFHAKADRDQAILLITDGDDQQSYPLEAASVAAERRVTVFTVGLGDADQGARIPQKTDAKTFMTYEGQQVWSKLDNQLLQQIALKTSGVYVPAGTRAYDLGELYTNHLQGRRGNDAASQQRIRRSERYQIFLAIALGALLADLFVLSHRRAATLRPGDNNFPRQSHRATTVMMSGVFAMNALAQAVCAEEPHVSVRDGLRLYSAEKYDEAREKFAAANEELDKQKSSAASIAAFDEACAAHRKGDIEHARDCYLRAGLSHDKDVATSAHFNLGTLEAEKARMLSGERPELVPPEKRQEILDHVAQAAAAYRHCLELRPDHVSSRRNLELVRRWAKYYSDQWRARDRQKRRDESNLFVFLEFLIQTQTALRQTVTQLPETVHSDELAELKRAQEELRDEIPTLREKIATDLKPPPDPSGKVAPQDSKELEEGITLLQGWADTAGSHMSTGAVRLGARLLDKAAAEQQVALDELDQIWEAIIPFHPLLSRLLSDQTSIANGLMPAKVDDDRQQENPDDGLPRPMNDDDIKDSRSPKESLATSALEDANDQLKKWEDAQNRTLKRTRLLAPKAEAELSRLESAPQAAASAKATEPDETGDSRSPATVDPELAKAGFRTAIELAPKAVEQMESAIKSLRQKDRLSASQQAEEARRILEEIQKAQPKNDQKQKNQDKNEKQDQKQQQDQKGNDDKKDDPKKNEDQKKDEQSKDDDKKNQDKKNEDKKDDKQSQNPQQKQSDQKQQVQVSKDRIEEALRKVRERQQEKRERDRKLKGQFLGKVPVDKDW